MPAVLDKPAQATTPTAAPEVTARIQGDFIMLAIPIKKDLPKSKSGGSRLLAQTTGFQKLPLTYEGLPVTVSSISVIVPLPEKAPK